MKTNTWVKIRNQSLARYTREAGFDLSVYQDYNVATQRELKKAAIKNAIYGIKYAFEDEGIDLSSLRTGVYVISLSPPFTLRYHQGCSPVIYIGIGNVIGRIKSHFENSLFDFMQSLSGTNFDFSFSLPELDGHHDYYKHTEWLMLEEFARLYGGNGVGKYPILNKNAGSKKRIDGGGYWWKSPLRKSAATRRWEIKPIGKSEFARLED